MVFLPRKKQFLFEVIWLPGASSRASSATESWEGPTWAIKSSSWACRGHAKSPTNVPGEIHTSTTAWAQVLGCDTQVCSAQHSTGGTCAEDSKQD